MKIIQIYSYYPPNLGGAQQRVRDLSERLAKKGHQVEVFTSNVGCPKDKQLKSTKNLKIHYLKAKEFAHTPIIPSLYKELMKIPQDSIMHVHVSQAYVPEIVYKVWKKRKIPYIAHIRADVKPSSLIGKMVLGLYKNIFLRKFLKCPKRMIVLTKDYKELISKKYKFNINKIRVIPNGNSFNIKSSRKVNSHKDNIKLLFVGRLSPGKNIPLLLDSFKNIYKKYRNIVLDIVGEGEEKKYIEKLILKNNLQDNVFLKGRLDGKDLENAYQNSDIFISPTKYESFGAVYLEAMASGIPIITSNVICVRNIVKNNYNGLLCNQTSEAFANAIERLIKNPKLRERLARNGLKEVKKYSWDKIVEQTEKVYEEVLREDNKNLNKK